MKLLITIATISSLFSVWSVKAESVHGYTRRDGTYVAPYTRSAPDNYRSNNYGSQSFGGSQRDEYSSNPATNRGNSSYGGYDNDNDGRSNAFDSTPNNGNRW